MELETFIAVDDRRFADEMDDVEGLCRKVCRKSWEVASAANPMLPQDNVEVSILLADDGKIREINREYRGKDNATNVISFASIDSEEPDDGVFVAGDIIMSYDTIKREAEENKTAFRDRFIHILVHGMLHLAGFDHENDDEANHMEKLEADILETFAVKNPYV